MSDVRRNAPPEWSPADESISSELIDPAYPRTTGSTDDRTASEKAKDAASTGRERAGAVATTAGDSAKDVASTATGEAREVARTATDQARRLMTEAKHELRTQADTQFNRVADTLDDLGRQLRSLGERGDEGPVTDLAREAARRTDQLAWRMRDGGFDSTVGQLRTMGRNRPGLFLLGAFGLGLAAGRVARSLAQSGNGHSSAGNVQGAYEGVPTQPMATADPEARTVYETGEAYPGTIA
jgi:hypothetical protein